jgi:GTPase
MAPENPEGNKEYKLKLSDNTIEKVEKLASQMRYRMQEGGGEAIYTIGVTDSGEMLGIDPEEFEKTKAILTTMASKNNFSINFISEQKTEDGKGLYECHVREKNIGKYVDLRVACAGNVDTGKCEAADTLIQMANGEPVKIQDIAVGDILAGDTGPRKVLSTTKGHGLLFKIEHEYGDPLVVNKNHILSLVFRTDENVQASYVDVPFHEYIELPDKIRDMFKLYTCTPDEDDLQSKILNITNVGMGDYYGFELDGNGRYLHLDGTVTHNSSLLGVLLTGKGDDGRGSARLNVFNYKHEVRTGRSSSVAQHILGFTDSGEPVHYLDSFGYQKTWPEIVSQSSKIVTFFDLCGHERYLKTTIFGLTSQYPDIAFVLVGGNMGLTKMTKEHIFLCLSLGIPFAVVVTKIDICKGREAVLEETVKDVKKILTAPGIRKIPYDVKTQDDVDICAKNMNTGVTVPILYVSNVTREGIPWVYRLLNLYTKRSKVVDPANRVEVHVDQTFTVSGIGTVVGGQLVQGSVKVGDKLLIGPENGSYTTLQVRSIHCKRVPMDEVESGRYVCLGVRKPDGLAIRRGHVMVSTSDVPYQVTQFEAEVTVVKTHSTTIKVGYEPIVHCGSIRQTGRILEIRNKQCSRGVESASNVLRTGDRAILKFRFCYKPEFVKKGARILLAEGGVKIIGKIVSVEEERLNVV